jgi:hypothetical protein
MGVLHIILKVGHPKIISAFLQIKMNSNFNCSYMAMSSLTYILGFSVRFFRTIEEMSIFSNSSHLEWRVGLLDTFLKGTHPSTIPARFGVIWFSGFRGDDLNVIFYQNMPNLHNRYKCLTPLSAIFQLYHGDQI